MSHRIGSFCALLIVLSFLTEFVELEHVDLINWRTGEMQGTVAGNMMTSSAGREFHAFRGIPYAKPPVGPLRFKSPVAADPWEHVLDATKDIVFCPQPSRNDSYKMSENCLFINVYTPQIPTDQHQPLPVIIYIHPGAFVSGSGSSEFYAGPEYLLEYDVVMVAINYRLGALGFLSTGDTHSPGNYGLKDQVMALEWVRDYIGSFGGDPNLVTLLGYSAGAISVTLHMVSPMSKGLFHRGIAMSGSGVLATPWPHSQLDTARRQAELFDCPIDDNSLMMACLRNVDPIELALSIDKLYIFANVCPFVIYGPVVELDFGQLDPRFLEDQPTKLFQMGQYERVPLMTGTVYGELADVVTPIITSPANLQLLNNNFTELAPICFFYESGTDKSRMISRTLRNAYLPGPIQYDDATRVGLCELFSDALIGFPLHRLVELASNGTSVHYYQNIYKGQYTVANPLFSDMTPIHDDDLRNVIVYRAESPLVNITTHPDGEIIKRTTRLWTQFALTGNPNVIDDTDAGDVVWQESSSKLYEYLEIGRNFTMKQLLHNDRYQLFNTLFPLKPISGEDDS